MYENGFQDGMEDSSHEDLFGWCQLACGECYADDHFEDWQFENHDSCERIGFDT